jgi:hypothetical protein
MNIHEEHELMRRFEEYMQKRDPFFRNIKRMINGVYCVKDIEYQWQEWLKENVKSV